MTKHNLKAIYAEGNPNFRIVYMPGGTWRLQEFVALAEGTDRRKAQPWHDLNTNMSYADAIVRLAGYAKRRA